MNKKERQNWKKSGKEERVLYSFWSLSSIYSEVVRSWVLLEALGISLSFPIYGDNKCFDNIMGLSYRTTKG